MRNRPRFYSTFRAAKLAFECGAATAEHSCSRWLPESVRQLAHVEGRLSFRIPAHQAIAEAALVDSGAVGVEKPDPKIFRLALEALGADPARTAYVGDMPLFDVVGAKRAGLRPLLMDPYALQHRMACEKVTSLDDVLSVLRRSR